MEDRRVKKMSKELTMTEMRQSEVDCVESVVMVASLLTLMDDLSIADVVEVVVVRMIRDCYWWEYEKMRVKRMMV